MINILLFQINKAAAHYNISYMDRDTAASTLPPKELSLFKRIVVCF